MIKKVTVIDSNEIVLIKLYVFGILIYSHHFYNGVDIKDVA
jgi:hypothetical protein